MATITYYEVLTARGTIARPSQLKAYGPRRYGYQTLAAAKRACPKGCSVWERHTDGANDWGGLMVWTREA